MRMLHLYELYWTNKKSVDVSQLKDGERVRLSGYKVIAATKQAYSNAGIRNLYNYLRVNGNRPYMTELPNGDIRIQYFKKGEGTR
nr:MAG TPA: hypothetical protein [Bacteriophage sp.]